ncbi:type III-B CRISPR module RAMP protein Cmr6 [Methylomarinum vadi]|uniref:type III-B CRISPR module RAMP protein Cmr6 n=1 Tax=Methylomarinum vadi TaxID=438855 RepID=UPI0004DF0B29|nr:type III-B CRISPR module RAMP protein Cmr6 [Methylomarinum vadi]
MTKAALPNYMDKHLKHQDIPPGHIFGMYFPVWQNDWKKVDQQKTDALKKALSIAPGIQKMQEALVQRQRSAALNHQAIAYFSADSIAPFVTGLGNEHPLENGFAFLNPYGLPYFPGSSVKGVLRMAAEELALGLYGETQSWDMLTVWLLFGFEGSASYLSDKVYHIDILDQEAEKRREAYRQWLEQGDYDQDALKIFIRSVLNEHEQKQYLEDPRQFLKDLPGKDISLQGALSFWDVYPQSKNLAMDILTPHHGEYFQGKHGPHDSEQPNPNVFLTIPPGSRFDFYCTAEAARLPENLQQHWQTLLQQAFHYAFDWLGFGAKTAVGYGQMTERPNAMEDLRGEKAKQEQRQKENAEKLAEQQRLANLPPIEREMAELIQSNNDPQKKDYLVLLDAVKNHADWQSEDKEIVLTRVKVMMQECGDWKETSKKKKPQQDKPHQRTLEVIRLLKDF